MPLCASKNAVGVEEAFQLPSGLKLAPVYAAVNKPEGAADGDSAEDSGLVGIKADGSVETQVAGVRVVLRVRPLIDREKSDKGSTVLQLTSNSSLKILEDPSGASKATPQERQFTFDRVLGPAALLSSGAASSSASAAGGQEEAYMACAAPILERVMQGYNGCIFAYGQTGSGKTFTMEGEASTAKQGGGSSGAAAGGGANRPPSGGSTPGGSGGGDALASLGPGAGVIPRLCGELFKGLQALPGSSNSASGGATGKTAPAAASTSPAKPPTAAAKGSDLGSPTGTGAGGKPPSGKATGSGADTSGSKDKDSNSGVSHSYTITATYVEIYQERLLDLLSTSTVASTSGGSGAGNATPGAGADDEDGGPRIRQTVNGTIVLEGAVTRTCAGPADVAKLLKEGQGRRTRGETNMNALSSRSHAVLTLHITVTRTETAADASPSPSTGGGGATPGAGGGETVSLTRTCKLSLIDLAGSERAEATGATGARLKEGAQINLSLTCLGRVINALTTMPEGATTSAAAQAAVQASAANSGSSGGGGGAVVHVPYRDSKLTRLLQDSLGGSAYTCMVACVSPSALNYDETLATLRFAQRAKKVQNRARLNVDPREARVAALTAEVKALRAKLGVYEEALARRAVPRPVAAAVPELQKEAGLQLLVGGGDVAAAVLRAYHGADGKDSKDSTSSLQERSGKGGCSIM